jgi:alkanesulfonate monooxygenase SsuD/methylene tetrahydromethanopterin reductase-like flavin-dependent oxidoreductase (luciferase family)
VAGIGTFISPGRSLERAITRARLADELGFDSVYATQIAGRDALTVLAAYAVTTNRIKVGTGVLPIFSRTPVATAQTAATIDELSGGRMVLGIGVSHQVTVENWFDSKIEKPVSQMREYAGIVRAILRGEQPPEGKFFNTKFQFMGYEPRPELPIYIAALSPNMLRLAGEIADGVMLWVCTHAYVRDVVIPEATKGREKAGKTLEGFDVVAAVPAALTDDREQALGALRQELVTYFSLPFYRAAIERSGYADDVKAFDEGIAAGDVERAKSGISETFLDALGGIGSEQQVKDGVTRYLDAGTVSPCVGGIPGTDFEGTLGAVSSLLAKSASG